MEWPTNIFANLMTWAAFSPEMAWLPLVLSHSDMASRLLESTGDILTTRMDDCCNVLHNARECPEKTK